MVEPMHLGRIAPIPIQPLDNLSASPNTRPQINLSIHLNTYRKKQRSMWALCLFL